MLSVIVEVDVWNWNPTAALFQAVLRLIVKSPVCELSVNPFAALLKEMQFVTLCEAKTIKPSPPPPSLKPFPSPSKSVKPQRLNPLPQDMVLMIVTGEPNSLDVM